MALRDGYCNSQAPSVQPAPRTEFRDDTPPISPRTSANVGKSSTPLVQPLIRTEHGNTVSWSTKSPFTMSVNKDKDGRDFRFSHCPWLSFQSLQHAFDYFQVQTKLYDQRVIHQQRLQRLQAAQLGFQVAQRRLQAEQRSYLVEDLSLRAGQLADFATQQACSAKALNPFEPVRQLDPPFKPIGVQPIANIPKPPSRSASDSQCQLANELLGEGEWEEPDPVHSSSMSSPLDPPPQTLFAESTPHAQEIQTQPRVRLPVKGSQIWPFQSQVTKTDPFLHFISAKSAVQAVSNPSVSHHLSTCIDTALPQILSKEVDISKQPPISLRSCSLPPYADTVLPETLNKKDRRFLGVSSSASNDE